MSFLTDLISMLKDVFATKPVSSNLETTEVIIPNVSNRPVPKKLLQCKPELQQLAIQFLDACEKQGISVCIYYGFRTHDEQAALYAQGRTTPGKIVTNAKPGQSAHEAPGCAFDAAPLINGKIDWNSNLFDTMGPIGESVGLVWGGRFKTICDRPHYQLPS
jgi:peptidoglycan L-alanyl-D-glutamate endopeptidase CwlK